MKKVKFLPVLFIVGLFLFTVTQALAHNVDQRTAWIFFDPETATLIADRAATNDRPLIRDNDIVNIIIKSYPEPAGADVGAGGYVTFYIPPGTQVVGASYVWPDGMGGFMDIPVKGQAQLAMGVGGQGPENTPELIGLQLGPNYLGVLTDTVTAGGDHRGTLAGVYADTGIFFATTPKMGFESWATNPAGGYLISNNQGDTVRPWNTWDAEQLLAYGSGGSDYPINPIVDGGRGTSPWGLGNVVAGPQSGYAWHFDLDLFDDLDPAGTMQPAVSNFGPWQRIQYQGSLIADDIPGNLDGTLGWVGSDASLIGWNLSPANPLSPTLSITDTTSPKAIRWAVGQLTAGRMEYVKVRLRIIGDPGDPGSPFDEDGCFKSYGEVIGGDAGGPDDGKDHLWRYYDPTRVELNACAFLYKRANTEFVNTGDTITYTIQFINTGIITFTNLEITDFPGAGLNYNGASPTPNNSPADPPAIWNIPLATPGYTFTAIVTATVTAGANQAVFNTATATTDEITGTIAITESTWVGSPGAGIPMLLPNKYVDQSVSPPGNMIQYTLVVSNVGNGPSDTGQNIILNDALPNDFLYGGSFGASINGVPDPGTTVDATDPENPIFTILGPINPGESIILTFTAYISDVVPAAFYNNTFSVEYNDPNVGVNNVQVSGATVEVVRADLGDYIFFDWNNNGLQELGEDGIPGVVLTLTLPTGGYITTTTNANGNYLFPDLVPGTYTVTVDTNTLPPDYVATFDPDEFGVCVICDAFTSATVTGTIFIDTLDFGYFKPLISKTVNPTITVPGGVITYNFFLNDYTGTRLLSSAILTDNVPFGSTYQAGSVSAGGGEAAGVVSWNLGSNAAGTTAYVAGGAGGVITLTTPIADTSISEANPDDNFGITDPLEGLDRDGQDSEILLQFDVSGVPAGAVIDSAILELQVDRDSANMTVNIHRMLTSWTEGAGNGGACVTGATWNAPNCSDSWSGGAFSSADYNAAVGGSFVPDLQQQYQVEVAPIVQDWANGAANNGFLLFAVNPTDNNRVDIFSREGSPQPRLIIEYSFPNRETEIFASPLMVQGAGSLVTVTMQLSATGAIANVAPTAPVVNVTNGTSAVLSTGPTPATVNVPANGMATISWVYAVSPGAVPGTVSFTSDATNGTYNFASADSLSVMVIPDLSFRVIADNPALIVPIVNNGNFDDFGLFSGGLDSNDVLTYIDIPQGGIGDSLWLDENGDGIQDAGESGIPNVVVELEDSDGNIITTTTDMNGNYLFPNLVAGTYTVTVDVTTLPPGLDNPTGDPDELGGPCIVCDSSTTINLGDDEMNLDADFGYNWVPSDDTTDGTGTGAIGDMVWNDANGNGILDPGESGIAGVTVNLYADLDGDGEFTDVISTTVTGPNGMYIFDGVQPNAYVVGVTPPGGYSQTADPDETGVCTVCNNQSNPIIVAPGDVYLNADFGYQPNSGGATIGDTIFLDLDADGSQGGSEPGLADVTVVLLDANGVIIATTVTDANGNYAFPGLPDGDYSVWVNDINNVTGELVQSGDPDQAGTCSICDDMSSVTIVGGADNLDQDFGYTFATMNPFTGSPGLIGDTIWFDQNGDGIQQPTEGGLQGVTVSLELPGGSTVTTVTDANGNYYFPGLPAGSYTVTVTPPAGMIVTDDPIGGTSSSNPINLGDGEINLDQDFGLTAAVPGIISGTIWNDADGNGTLDEAGNGLAGVTVDLYDDLGNLVASTVTDANGDYSFPGLPAGDYVVDVTDEDNLLNGWWHSDGPNDGLDNNSQTDTYPVTLPPGGTDTTADFGYYIVEPEVLGNFVWQDINGDGIQDPGEPGIPGVQVTLIVTYPNGSVVNVSTVTDLQGYYNFDVLVDENYDGIGIVGVDEPAYEVVVIPPYGYAPSPVDQGGDDNFDSDGVSTTAAPIRGSNNDSYDFGFQPTGAIGDTIWLDEDGNGIFDAGESGIPNVVVSITDGSVTYTTTTDMNGNYLFPNLPPGSWDVTVDTSSLATGLNNPTGDPDETGGPCVVCDDTTTVNLGPGELYDDADFGYNWVPSDDSNDNTGTGALGNNVWIDADGDGIQDPGEAGLAGVTVELFADLDGDGSYTDLIDTVTTGPDGFYMFDDLAPDAYVAVVTPPAGYNQSGDPDESGACVVCDSSSNPIIIGPGDVYLDADFGYQPTSGGATIGDTIFMDFDGDGAQGGGETGVGGVTIVLLDNVGNVIATTTTDANGNYAFPGLPDGDYTVWVNDVNNVLAEVTQSADPDQAGICTVCDGMSSVTLVGGADNLNQDFGYTYDTYIPNSGTPGLIGDTVWFDQNGDGVQQPTEGGMQGIPVTLELPGGGILTTVTDVNGNYYFPGLPADTYTVTITVPAGMIVTDDPIGGTSSSSVVNLADGEINLDQDFGLAAAVPGNIGGTIWNDGDANGTLDEVGAGIIGVTVGLYDSNGNLIATTTTDANGDYNFAGLPAGDYSVNVLDGANALGDLWHSDGPNDGLDNNSQTDPYNVTLPTGGSNTTADFGYYDSNASVGNFVWEDLNSDGIQDVGEPGMVGVTVTLMITYPNGVVIQLVTFTDGSGNYSFENLLPDEDFDGVGTPGVDEPEFTLIISLPSGYVATMSDQGGDDDLDSDGTTISAGPIQGSLIESYDLGLVGVPTAVSLSGFGTVERSMPIIYIFAVSLLGMLTIYVVWKEEKAHVRA